MSDNPTNPSVSNDIDDADAAEGAFQEWLARNGGKAEDLDVAESTIDDATADEGAFQEWLARNTPTEGA